MAASTSTIVVPLSRLQLKDRPSLMMIKPWNGDFRSKRDKIQGYRTSQRHCTSCLSRTAAAAGASAHDAVFELGVVKVPKLDETSEIVSNAVWGLLVGEIDPATAKVAIGVLGPLLSAFSFLFIVRIVMSWYPKLPIDKFPYVLAYAPTEPILVITRKVIPPVGGVDVTPVVWFGLLSFANEILVGPQGLLVLLSQQV
uniref:Protein COFACTOR ASSEMBLY OF COMPLEX C SUBUNIT B CCB3, chloroplastic n=1 Tax=Kalanchoe fedtschenkoi TaxID=63787 RepID=A0A7N0UIX8_KALFE